ncbi:MAG: DUF6502 family protein [Woeseiaceae bacterium]|nr:DUF6502 family protein [Woeseiaceae bacterium]
MEHDTRLLRALRTLFYPLASVLLKNKVGVAPVVHQLKLAFAEVARKKHGRGGRPATNNKIANLTGMSRKHVGNLLDEVDGEPCKDRISAPVLPHVLAMWCANDEYTDKMGLPRELERGPGVGTLRTLVSEHNYEDDPDQAIEQLLRSGNIRQLDDGRFQLVDRGYYINRDLPALISTFLSPLANTLDKNWDLPLREGLALRIAHTEQLASDKIPMIRRVAKERLTAVLERLDDELSRNETEFDQPMLDVNGVELSMVGVGVYYFEQEKLQDEAALE